MPATTSAENEARGFDGVKIASIVRARRWMVSGLVISILGTRLIEGGINGSAVVGVIPVVWISILATTDGVLTFCSPLIAKIFSKINPASTLTWSDAAECALSLIFGIMFVMLGHVSGPLLVVYLLLVSVFPAITDVVEEFYGEQLAKHSERHALVFNSSIYSILGFVGLVLGMPLGAAFGGTSFTVLIFANAAFSGIGWSMRFKASSYRVTGIEAQDAEDFSAMGTRMRLRTFARRSLDAGLASPVVSGIGSAATSACSIFFYMWIARTVSPNHHSLWLAVVIAVFGLGATIGPLLAPLLTRTAPPLARLVQTYLATFVILLTILILVISLPAKAAAMIAIPGVFALAVASRLRTVLTSTFRQVAFTGNTFSSLMSWSFAFGAVGSVAGSWFAYTTRVDLHPEFGLATYLIGVVGIVLLHRYSQADREIPA